MIYLTTLCDSLAIIHTADAQIAVVQINDMRVASLFHETKTHAQHTHITLYMLTCVLHKLHDAVQVVIVHVIRNDVCLLPNQAILALRQRDGGAVQGWPQ